MRLLTSYFGDFFLAFTLGLTPAQLTYEGRTDLGNTQPGDGKNFKGYGPIQITGRANITAVAQALQVPNLINDPTLLTEPDLGSGSAAWFWQSRDLNPLADRDDLLSITQRINGGLNGLDDRAQYLHRAKQVLITAVGQLTRILSVRSPMLHGPDVESVQMALNRIFPHKPISVDGWYGPRTERMVRRFQQSTDLQVDGIVGPQTWAALRPSSGATTAAVLVGSIS